MKHIKNVVIQRNIFCHTHNYLKKKWDYRARTTTGNSEVAYDNDCCLLAQGARFGARVLWYKVKLFGGGCPILKVRVRARSKVKGQTSLFVFFQLSY